MKHTKYSVTYAIDDRLREEGIDYLARISAALTELRRDGVDVGFLGATQEIDAAGRLVEMTVSYDAPSKGAIGQLNVQAQLPASGSPQREDATVTGPTSRPLAVAR